MALYYKNAQFVTADGKDFILADSKRFFVRLRQSVGDDVYFEDTENSNENLNTIAFGSYTFSGRKIDALKLHHESGLLTDQLAIDTLTATVKSDTKPTLTRYTPITVSRGGNVMAVFFNGQIKEAGYKIYSLYAESYITLLDYGYHYGDIYTGQVVETVVAEIMGDLPYTIHPDVAAVKLYGYLPHATKRENLLQILIATGAAIRRNANGTMNITALDGTIKGAFADARTLISGSLDEDTQVTAVQVAEHSYAPIEDEITLFTETFTDIRTATFTEPAHSLVCTNGTILESGANYARIQGDGAVILTGKKYRHTTKIVTRGDLLNTPDDKIVTVTDATLINTLNSSSVAQRLYNYAKCNRTVRQDVLINQERTGDMVQLVHPYGTDYLSVAIHSLDFSMSNILRASGEFLAGYEPQGISTGYQHRIVLTATGSWTVPAGITEARAVLIGGGQGGQGGFDGQNGTLGEWLWEQEGYVYDGGNGGKGSEGGAPGSSAKILDITIPVTPGQIIAATIGVGGTGGLNGAPGNAGTETTFGSYSTATGAVWEGGYVDVVTAELFAGTGNPGTAGADGGKGSQAGYGSSGSNTETATGGPGGEPYERSGGTRQGGGGGGGGAAYNTNGPPGGDAHYESPKVHGGDGGGGASPNAPAAASQHGFAGDGGHGGGGGGGAGGYRSTEYEVQGSIGPGGAGSQGGTGGPGCIIIYY